MAPLKTLLVLAASGAVASGFMAPGTFVGRPSTKVNENFGFDFAEDSYENQDALLRGEANYKQWVNKIDDNSFLNRKYNVIRRVREKDLLSATVDAGILSSLEEQGLTLTKLEELLPLIEELGLLSLVANNQQILQNGIAPLLIEPAPLLLPVVAGALKAGPSAFYTASAALLGTEFLLVANDVDLPLVGLSAGGTLGFLIVPLAVVLAVAGNLLGSLKK